MRFERNRNHFTILFSSFTHLLAWTAAICLRISTLLMFFDAMLSWIFLFRHEFGRTFRIELSAMAKSKEEIQKAELELWSDEGKPYGMIWNCNAFLNRLGLADGFVLFDIFNANEMGLLSIEYGTAEHIKGIAFFFPCLNMRWMPSSAAILSVNKREIYYVISARKYCMRTSVSAPSDRKMEMGKRSQMNRRCGPRVYEPVR